MSTDQERIFVRTVDRAPIFQHTKPAGGNLLLNALIEDDHAVSHIFLKAVTGDRIAFPPLTGNDRGNAAILQPAKKAT